MNRCTIFRQTFVTYLILVGTVITIGSNTPANAQFNSPLQQMPGVLQNLQRQMPSPQTAPNQQQQNQAPGSQTQGTQSQQTGSITKDDVITACGSPDENRRSVFYRDKRYLDLDDAVTARYKMLVDKSHGRPVVIDPIANQIQEARRMSRPGVNESECFRRYLLLLQSFDQQSVALAQKKYNAEVAAAAEQKRQEAAAAEQRRLDQAAEQKRQEAEKAQQEQEQAIELQKIADEKGPAFVKTSGTVWNISRTKNQMTDELDLKATSTQTNDTGVVANIEAVCGKKSLGIEFIALIVDRAGKPSIRFPNQTKYVIPVQRRINDEEVKNSFASNGDFANQFILIWLVKDQGMGNMKTLMAGDPLGVPVTGTWGIRIEINTTQDPIVIKIPVYEDAIQQVIKACT